MAAMLALPNMDGVGIAIARRQTLNIREELPPPTISKEQAMRRYMDLHILEKTFVVGAHFEDEFDDYAMRALIEHIEQAVQIYGAKGRAIRDGAKA